MENRNQGKFTSSKVMNRIRSGVVICDGAMGTEFEKRGVGSNHPSPWCNIQQPKVVESIHRSYVEAGARLILTNTFGANRATLTKQDSPYGVEELNRAAVAIARRASQCGNVLVFGNISSTGCEEQLLLGARGESPDETAKRIYSAFAEQAKILEEAGVDGILVETMSYLREAVLAVDAATKNTKLPVFCTMAFRVPIASESQDFRTHWGDSVESIISEITNAGACGVGANCGELVDEMPLLAQKMRQLTDIPLFFEINAGRPQIDSRNETLYHLGPDPWADIALGVIDQGANVIGGCCGTTPLHIAGLRNRLGSRTTSK